MFEYVKISDIYEKLTSKQLICLYMSIDVLLRNNFKKRGDKSVKRCFVCGKSHCVVEM